MFVLLLILAFWQTAIVTFVTFDYIDIHDFCVDFRDLRTIQIGNNLLNGIRRTCWGIACLMV